MELGLLPIRTGNSNVTMELPYQNFRISVSSVAFRVVGEGSYMFPYIHIQGSCLADFLRGVFVSIIAVHNSYDIPPA